MNNPIKNEVSDFIKKYAYDIQDKPILVAFSGGFDSTCLLHVLLSVTKNKIIAIHLNHGWRGKESDDEELRCRSFCESFNVEFYSEKLSENVKKTETDAREARYEFFERCAKKFGTDILTWNQLDYYANAIPLGSFSYALAFIIYGFYRCKIYRVNDTFLWSVILLFGGIGQCTAGFLEWCKGRHFPTALYLSYGFYCLSHYAFYIIPEWFVLNQNVKIPFAASIPLGLFFLSVFLWHLLEQIFFSFYNV